MSYDLLERSADAGRPVELLKLSYADRNYCYTNADEMITYLDDPYLPTAMDRGDFGANVSGDQSSVEVRLPMNVDIFNLFRVQPPYQVVSATIFGMHAGDADFIVIWRGRIVSVSIEPPFGVLNMESIFTSLQRAGNPRTFSTQCRVALYSARCGVSKSAHEVLLTVTSVSGLTVTCAAAAGVHAANHFAAGFITWESNVAALTEARMVKSFDAASGTFGLATAPVGLVPGMQIKAYPGCNHALTGDCQNKFGNTLNYQGQPFIPKKNPFSGSILF